MPDDIIESTIDAPLGSTSPAPAVIPATPAPSSSGPIGTATGAPVDTPAPSKGDDEGEKGKRVSISQEALNKRIDQAKTSATEAERARLREIFGTDDPEAIKKIRQEHEALKTEKEQAERARMTREQQLEADLKAEREKATQYEERLKKLEQQRLYDKQDSIIRRVAMRHINDKKLDDAVELFAIRVLKTMTPKQAAKVTERDLEKWFADYAKDTPGFARATGTAPAPVAPKVRPASNGARPAPKPSPVQPGTSQKKAIRPGMPNSMTTAEWNEEKRRRGISY